MEPRLKYHSAGGVSAVVVM